MEWNKILSIMKSYGFTNYVGPIFNNWETVKDEMLLPSRKSGTGNGTVHVYLMEANMEMFEKCFPEYFSSLDTCSHEQQLAPRIKHFVQASNLITLGGNSFLHLGCDFNKFNYTDFVKQVMSIEENDIVSFNSLFKFSTDRRPYFKQFDKDVFGKIIRYLFIPQKTGYKIYLFTDESRRMYACFWLFGQVFDQTYSLENDVEHSIVSDDEGKIEGEKGMSFNTVLNQEKCFKNYILSIGRSEKTADCYVRDLKNLIPKAQKMVDGYDHESPYVIRDYSTLCDIDKSLWSNPAVIMWNKKGHNRASASFHMYMEMVKNSIELNNVENISRKLKPENRLSTQADPSLVSGYKNFLKNERGMSDITVNSYASSLYNKFSELLNGMNPSFKNVFEITDYPKLLELDSIIWDMDSFSRANNKSGGRLSAAFRAYLDYIEHSLSDEDLAELAFGDKA